MLTSSKARCNSLWLFGLALLIAGAFVMASPLSAWALHKSGHAATSAVDAEDVRDTLHNLSSGGFNVGVNIASTENEVCVFCHTPHGGNPNDGAGGGVAQGFPPLWNRGNPTGPYTLYSSPHFEGDDYAGAPRGVSLACLSCHDGTLALDNGVNFSGSGGFQGTAGARTNRVNAQGGSALLDAGGTMDEGTRTDTGPNYGVITGAGSEPFPNLGTTFVDDHPFSMRIPSATAPCSSGVAIPDPQFDDVCAGSTTSQNGITFLKRSTATNAGYVADKRDRIRSYPTETGGMFIECASCHNPHAPRPVFLRLPSYNTTAAATVPSGGGTVTVANMIGGTDTDLLSSKPNAGSLVCLSCHQK